ncbi:MerR family transcriptional regulator [Chelatococcus daeguensis]|uniref:HTH merR-type domain-containing protein n=2 Tax=Chelatococcus TaxID=28209 RepID=A0AAC9NYB2_9HYPH|nr:MULTISPECIES: MerR family transcriptional regulator [Chelatococcus]APF37309.1 hypothetical protein BOQ54_08170 [Chelatococcus daeguensis]KZE35896.1 hypothetical protein AVW15_13280 [Chelatococcus daeguensis]MBM3085210.1 MerR family transcriptional regulator [Chelatococcus daeguensis]CUA90147.1 MerR HTH family regulatory protein [Chelatococcus sambhunathii]
MDKGPDAFRTISEVAEDLDLPQHVLRFWETRFSQIKPLKRGGGRRYYRPDDVDLLRGIRHLLYGEGYTIKGVQRILKEEGVRYVETIWRQDGTAPAPVARADVDDAKHTPAFADAPEDGAFLFDDGALMQAPPTPAPVASTPSGRGPAADAATLASAGSSGLTAAQRRALQAVLAELAECRRLLDAARRGADGDA